MNRTYNTYQQHCCRKKEHSVFRIYIVFFLICCFCSASVLGAVHKRVYAEQLIQNGRFAEFSDSLLSSMHYIVEDTHEYVHIHEYIQQQCDFNTMIKPQLISELCSNVSEKHMKYLLEWISSKTGQIFFHVHNRQYDIQIISQILEQNKDPKIFSLSRREKIQYIFKNFSERSSCFNQEFLENMVNSSGSSYGFSLNDRSKKYFSSELSAQKNIRNGSESQQIKIWDIEMYKYKSINDHQLDEIYTVLQSDAFVKIQKTYLNVLAKIYEKTILSVLEKLEEEK